MARWKWAGVLEDLRHLNEDPLVTQRNV